MKLFRKKTVLLKVTVKEEYRANFHNVENIAIGIKDSENRTHLWIKPVRHNLTNEAFMGSITRYPKYMVDVEEVR